MKKYNFEDIIDRRKTMSAKWGVGENEIPLSVADMDFSVMPEIREAIEKRSREDAYGYVEVSDAYFDSYVNWFTKRYNAVFTGQDCIFSTGVVSSLDSLLKRILKPAEKILMLTPIYNTFFNVVKNCKLDLVCCPFIYENHFYRIDWEEFQRIIESGGIKAFLLCNPHNPIGKQFSREEIQRFIDLCHENDVYFLSDEIHCDLDYNEKRYNSVLSFNTYPKTIVLLSPGKSFNLAGLHSSIVVVKDKELREVVQKGFWEDDVGEPNYFAIDPVIAAYTNGEEYIYELNNYLKANREYVESRLKKWKNIYLIPSEATYLLWIDISYYGDSDMFTKELKEMTGLVLLSGERYGDNHFVRMNIATNKKTLKEAMDRLDLFLANKSNN